MYADVIIDISVAALDRTFQYRVPETLSDLVEIGTPVMIPFGSSDKLRKGYVVGLGTEPKFEPGRTKEIAGIAERELTIEDTMVGLAYWIRKQYGGTFYDSLRTVLPVRKKVQKQPKRIIRRIVPEQQIRSAYAEAAAKKHKAKARLLEPLCTQDFIPYEIASGKMNIAKATIDYYVGAGLLEVSNTTGEYYAGEGLGVSLNDEQEKAAEAVLTRRSEGKPFLLFGITGSGKTEVYIKIIRQILDEGKQAIVLIPEIALTYQTLLRFYRCFGDRVGYVHSKMALSERYQMCEKARAGEISVMIGPRSALFTPFSNLGLIVIDEEQELSYHSETTPKYYSDEVARKRVSDCNAALVLGSATPSVKSFRRAETGEYILLEITKRAKEGAELPKAEIVDMREELAGGNRSIFSRKLRQAITDCLSAGQQAMLFLNRRGFSGFLSCRSCGEVVKCPHCDVSMTVHRSGRLQCHYCGHTAEMPKVCPACGSKYIAAFGTGTQKIEELVKKEFPNARVMRMDADTTKGKDGYETILSAFAEGKADILVGTQMIVKGHDFGNVTLVGVLAADLSLGVSEYSAAERTFNLLAQAAGRAGRDRFPGQVVIQTYRPDHYALLAAAAQDYRMFYKQEIRYRKLAQYPPCAAMLRVLGLGKDEAALTEAMKSLAEAVQDGAVTVLGPAPDGMRYAMDIFRMVFYVKAPGKEALIGVRDRLEQAVPEGITLQFEFSE